MLYRPTIPSHQNAETDSNFHVPIVPSIPAALNLSPGAPLPFGANIAFMWSPSGNTLSPVLLQGNATVLPYPMPPSGPTPSALLPWPIAATLPLATTGRNETVSSLTSRATDPVISASIPSSPDEARPALLSRMTNDLAARLRDPVQSVSLSRLSNPHELASRLSDTPGPSLMGRIGAVESMDVELPPSAADLMVVDDPYLAAINDQMATAGPLVLDPVQYDNPWRPGDPVDEDDDEDEQAEEVTWKKTKRGRQSGRRIQNIRRRDEEKEDHRRRKQRRF